MIATEPVLLELINCETLRDLLRFSGPCLTVVLPAGETASRLESSIAEAVQRLTAESVPPREIETLLRPLERLAMDPAIDAHSPWAQAILRCPGVFEHVWLTQPQAASVSAGSTFAVKRLIPELSRPAVFYILGVAKTGPTLWRCEGLHVERENGDIADAVNQSGAPVILAGSVEDREAYRAISPYRHLATCSLDVTPDALLQRPAEILRDAYAALRQDEIDHRTLALAEAKAVTPTARFSTDPVKIMDAAFEGRVAALYVKEGADKSDVIMNQAIVDTILHRGEVFAIPELPVAAALMRY